MIALHRLAAEAGVVRLWTDADGAERCVSDDSLRAVLRALGLLAESARDIAASRKLLDGQAGRSPLLLTADAGRPIALPSAMHGSALELRDEAGNASPVACDGGLVAGIVQPGYYRLLSDLGELTIAVAPERCPEMIAKTDGRRIWGVVLQIPSLRCADTAFGDFEALARAAVALGRRGADAVALSPIHAQFICEPGRFTPYSPSSRLALNALFGAADEAPCSDDAVLIDWAVAGPRKLSALQADFARLTSDDRAALARFVADQGDATVKPVEFPAFLQWRAKLGLDAAQAAARAAGMAIGLIADLAVGVDPAGSDVAADPSAYLQGLRIGAPPDPLGPQGQDWGLTSFSPHGLRSTGFAPFIAMLRANLPTGGGIRIDHGFGLQRLWVIPEGHTASEGAYLSYPFDDLLRIVKLEAHRADAVVIAEDLGTRPPGFAEAIAAAGIYGMAVLPFSRDEEGGFLPAREYSATAVAMSGTHDTATVAGWWTGCDLAWNDRLGRGGETAGQRHAARGALWDAIGEGKAPPDDAGAVVDAAFAFLGSTPAPLVLVPMEDVAGLAEQPNLPGTINEHPNWRRRLPDTIEALLDYPEITARIDRLMKARRL